MDDTNKLWLNSDPPPKKKMFPTILSKYHQHLMDEAKHVLQLETFIPPGRSVGNLGDI